MPSTHMSAGRGREGHVGGVHLWSAKGLQEEKDIGTYIQTYILLMNCTTFLRRNLCTKREN